MTAASVFEKGHYEGSYAKNIDNAKLTWSC